MTNPRRSKVTRQQHLDVFDGAGKFLARFEARHVKQPSSCARGHPRALTFNAPNVRHTTARTHGSASPFRQSES